MIKLLQKRFIAISIATLTFVVSVVFMFINYLNYYNITVRNEEILKKIQNEPLIIDQLIINNKAGVLSSDQYFYNGFVIFKLDKENKIINSYSINTRLEPEIANRLVMDLIKNPNKDNGYIDNYKYGYVNHHNSRYLLLIDVDKEFLLFYQFAKNSILVGLTIIVVASVFFIILAKKVVHPIETNYMKQKQFITDASHELKTPLTIISSNADVLEMEIGNSKWLSNIHSQIDRLTNLINSLVAFSRAEEKDSLDKSLFSMSELFESRVEDFSELANFKNKKIISNIQKDIFYNGDSQTIMQVIDILLDNAIKYADENSVIEANLNKNKKDVYLTVTNKSKDIVKGDLNVVFDRFYRLDESRNSKIKGYGIGLALAKLIVEKHKSSIKAFSPEDGEFVIEIKFS
ncbi:sensor histidine kinase [Gemelliphila palaticanis]|uniref:histidine kinase n=1 Tax=Gemelliphila palaticanis TaxID=81950 RepID=A0ABX2SWU3_9BACL|nr:HAMP domain-containing sensor histidine kinase [Gemella palaticanis]MBF0714711.1 HAMP domain-containing histidine kinase [Gemella palaticanis]NYS46641.1 HAMP domain-containing histidine kinase [Gemella palaticanis]